MDKLIGQKILVRTVTYFQLGEVVAVHDGFLELNGASWVADTGRLGQTIADGPDNLSEIEMLGDGVYVNLGAVIDIIPWRHKLPTKTK